jgi:hypothetical protein
LGKQISRKCISGQICLWKKLFPASVFSEKCLPGKRHETVARIQAPKFQMERLGVLVYGVFRRKI